MFDEIIEKTEKRLDEHKEKKSLVDLKNEISESESNDFPFKAIFDDEISIIAEINDVTVLEDVDADAVCLITEVDVFTQPIESVKDFPIDIPILRKDYIIDEYMIWESKVNGFQAVLLKASLLDTVQLKKFLDLSHDLGLSAVVEVSDADEIRSAMIVGAEIISVNNIGGNIENTIDLRRCLGSDVVFIADGGVKSKDDIIKLKENNINAILLDHTSIKSMDEIQ